MKFNMRRLIETVQSVEDGIPMIDDILVASTDQDGRQLLLEGVIDGRFKGNIRIDRPTHLGGAGDPHAHVYGRKGHEIVAVNLDGTASHGTRGRLHHDDAAALRARGFKIPADRVIEWTVIATDYEALLG